MCEAGNSALSTTPSLRDFSALAPSYIKTESGRRAPGGGVANKFSKESQQFNSQNIVLYMFDVSTVKFLAL